MRFGHSFIATKITEH